MIERLLEVEQGYVALKRNIHWNVVGVVIIFIVLATVIVTCNISSEAKVFKYEGCSSHDHCPSSSACIQGQCRDPCETHCGKNTSCTVINNVASCTCKEDFVGNPFIGCSQENARVWPPKKGKKRFYIGNHEFDWQGAFMNCLRNNSRLASIDNKDEFIEVKNMVLEEYGGVFWTSGSNTGSEGKFIWASTGRDLSTSSDMWLEDEPNNANNHIERCVDMHERTRSHHRGVGLNDRSCEDKCFPVCEYYG